MDLDSLVALDVHFVRRAALVGGVDGRMKLVLNPVNPLFEFNEPFAERPAHLGQSFPK